MCHNRDPAQPKQRMMLPWVVQNGGLVPTGPKLVYPWDWYWPQFQACFQAVWALGLLCLLSAWVLIFPGLDHRQNVCDLGIFCYCTPAAAKSLQSCPTLCDPIDGSPPGSPVPGILQARTLEWVAISFSDAWKWKVKVKSLSCVQLFATPWTAAYQAPPSMGFSRQQY